MAELVLFRPSKGILREIGFELEEPVDIRKSEMYIISTPLTVPGPFVMSVYNLLAEFYRPLYGWNVGEDNSHLEARSFADLINDATTNGLCHGNNGAVMMGVFLGRKGVCYGFRDFGDYFTRQDVKSLWESKNRKGIMKLAGGAGERTDKSCGHAISGAGAGVGYILEASDKIEVDNNLGVLYAVQHADRFLRL